jgi:hypothetical protein
MTGMRVPIARLGLLIGLIGGLIGPAPSATAQDAQKFAPIVGDWARHGFGITVHEDGRSAAQWRMYQWCGPGVPQPCDQMIDNEIVAGGRAVIRFSGADDSGAFQGEVLETTDPQLLDLGPLSMTPQPDDMALLEQGDSQLVLCGPLAADQAPPDVLEQCGA